MTSKSDSSERGGHNSGKDGRLDRATETLVDVGEESGEWDGIVTSKCEPCSPDCEECSDQAGSQRQEDDE